MGKIIVHATKKNGKIESFSIRLPRSLDLGQFEEFQLWISRSKEHYPLGGHALSGKQWVEIEGTLETILADAIQKPPARAYIIENVAKLIMLLGLEEVAS